MYAQNSQWKGKAKDSAISPGKLHTNKMAIIGIAHPESDQSKPESPENSLRANPFSPADRPSSHNLHTNFDPDIDVHCMKSIPVENNIMVVDESGEMKEDSQPATVEEQNREDMKDKVATWYQDWETKPYFVPPLLFNRIPLEKREAAGVSVFVIESPPETAKQNSHTAPGLKGGSQKSKKKNQSSPTPLAVMTTHNLLPSPRAESNGLKHSAEPSGGLGGHGSLKVTPANAVPTELTGNMFEESSSSDPKEDVLYRNFLKTQPQYPARIRPYHVQRGVEVNVPPVNHINHQPDINECYTKQWAMHSIKSGRLISAKPSTFRSYTSDHSQPEWRAKSQQGFRQHSRTAAFSPYGPSRSSPRTYQSKNFYTRWSPADQLAREVVGLSTSSASLPFHQPHPFRYGGRDRHDHYHSPRIKGTCSTVHEDRRRLVESMASSGFLRISPRPMTSTVACSYCPPRTMTSPSSSTSDASEQSEQSHLCGVSPSSSSSDRTSEESEQSESLVSTECTDSTHLSLSPSISLNSLKFCEPRVFSAAQLHSPDHPYVSAVSKLTETDEICSSDSLEMPDDLEKQQGLRQKMPVLVLGKRAEPAGSDHPGLSWDRPEVPKSDGHQPRSQKSSSSDQSDKAVSDHPQPAKSPRLDSSGEELRSSQVLWTEDKYPRSKPTKIMDSDIRDDFAQQHVLTCLQKLADRRQEPMFIISQLTAGDYLKKNAYIATTSKLPKPMDIPQKFIARCDFDLLIIHQQYGLLVGEIKSVGLHSSAAQSVNVNDIARRVHKSVKQLKKLDKILQHLVSDIDHHIPVRKTAIFPYVSRQQLQATLSTDKELAKEVCHCFGMASIEEATQFCLCSDELSNPDNHRHISEETLSKLNRWFSTLMTRQSSQPLPSDIYMTLLSRFVGPATVVTVHCVVPPRVEVRTLGDGVSELGERLSQLVLTPQQFDLLSKNQSRACLVGPPGTGKSLVLTLAGLQWVREGHVVVVLCVLLGSLAASYVVYHQIVRTLRRDTTMPGLADKVHFLQFDMLREEANVRAVLETLSAVSDGKPLHILMDEVDFSDKNAGPKVRELISELTRQSDTHLWASCMQQNVPAQLPVCDLTTPLRSAPVVCREVQQGVNRFKDIPTYNKNSLPAASDGPTVIRLFHEKHMPHEGSSPVDCYWCGQAVADTLRNRLGVGEAGPSLGEKRPPSLQYRDVFILTRDSGLWDDLLFPNGFVSGLRLRGIPVNVIPKADAMDSTEDWEAKVKNAALAKEDKVTVAYQQAVLGLERKVVVCLLGGERQHGEGMSRETLEARDRLVAMSRCTSQLIIVDTRD